MIGGENLPYSATRLMFIKSSSIIEERLEYIKEQERLKKIQSKKTKANYKHNVSRSEIEHNSNDIKLLARLIQAEALAESYEGKIAVGSVVINRMITRGKTLEGVIYARNQFSGVSSNLFDKSPSNDCIEAAKEVFNGRTNVGNATYFINKNVSNPSWIKRVTFVKRIGNHWFYKK